MPFVENISGVDREVPRLFGRLFVKAGETLEVPADVPDPDGETEDAVLPWGLSSFTCQTDIWRVSKSAKKAPDAEAPAADPASEKGDA